MKVERSQSIAGIAAHRDRRPPAIQDCWEKERSSVEPLPKVGGSKHYGKGKGKTIVSGLSTTLGLSEQGHAGNWFPQDLN